MLVCPASDRLQDALVELSTSLEVELLQSSGLVQVCNTRGRILGEQEALLVDLPWEAAPAFIKSSPLRGALREASLVTFIAGSTLGRPTASSAIEAGNTWIGRQRVFLRAAEVSLSWMQRIGQS